MSYKRNELGLLEGVKYEYSEDGSINWRAMVDPKHLYPNKGWFETRNQPMPYSVEGLEDNQLLIKLSGIKELAKLRGFDGVRYEVIKCEKDHVAVKCRIHWIPNFESGTYYSLKQGDDDYFNSRVSFEDIANATTDNTSSFAQKFLETIAANRAFVRCVRNFLNVHIVGADEIDSSNGTPPAVAQANNKEKFSPLNVLMDKTGLSH
ncbi:uncharacterized protein METZ01_LOCUS472373, partial [marine metagenome]